MQSRILPIPKHLQAYIECIHIVEYSGDVELAINVCLNGLPGIVFQHHQGHSPIENITTSSSIVTNIPTLYIYGQMTQPGIMNHKKEPCTTTQIVLKPHALQTLLGINASILTNTLVNLAEFACDDLNMQLLESRNDQERLTFITDFLSSKLASVPTPDCLIEESLRLIQKNSVSITVKHLLEHLNISERQFEKRFSQTVGLSPHFYIRVKRFNEAIRLIQSRQFGKLTDLAHALNFYDQSHFIRDIKAFSGITPKTLTQRIEDFQPNHSVFAYV